MGTDQKRILGSRSRAPSREAQQLPWASGESGTAVPSVPHPVSVNSGSHSALSVGLCLSLCLSVPSSAQL